MSQASDEGEVRATGGCLCGGVRYEVRGDLSDVTLCHCGQCRRTHGHIGAYTNTPETALRLTEAGGLRWFQSSKIARRGFCGECGASLFYDPVGKSYIAIAAGSLDQPTGLKCDCHLLTADAADYYEIDDGLKKYETWPGA